MTDVEVAGAEHVLGYHFRDPALLRRALTHSSLAYESGPGDMGDNEQLEFLGDAVIGLIAAEDLYTRFPHLEEGALTRLRAQLVSRRHLGEVALGLDLGRSLLLGRGEERSGGRSKQTLLANAIEALFGAVYLDGGLEAARDVIARLVIAPSAEALAAQLEQRGVLSDHKSALQERLQAEKLGQPEYAVRAESGPDHRKRFLVEVRLGPAGERKTRPGGRVLGRGIGPTKKRAEQEAARRALERLRRNSAEAMAEGGR